MEVMEVKEVANLEPCLLALCPPVDAGVCHCVGIGLRRHKAGEAKPDLADV